MDGPRCPVCGSDRVFRKNYRPTAPEVQGFGKAREWFNGEGVGATVTRLYCESCNTVLPAEFDKGAKSDPDMVPTVTLRNAERHIKELEKRLDAKEAKK